MFFKGKASQLIGTASGFLEVILSADFIFADYINTAMASAALQAYGTICNVCLHEPRCILYGIATQFTAQPDRLLNESFTSYKELIISSSIFD